MRNGSLLSIRLSSWSSVGASHGGGGRVAGRLIIGSSRSIVALGWYG